MYSIYCITNSITGKQYIGYTSNPDKRWQKHKINSRFGRNGKLYNSMRKHGDEVFDFDVLVEGIEDKQSALDLEIEFIDKYDTLALGYNLTKGGEGGDNSHLPQFQSAIKKVHSNKNPEDYASNGFKGKTHSEEAKKKQSEARQQYWNNQSIEDRKKFSQKMKGEKNPMYGKTNQQAIKVEFEGIVYDSLTKASKATGHSLKFMKKHGTMVEY